MRTTKRFRREGSKLAQKHETPHPDTQIQSEYRESMQALARTIDEFFNGNKKGDDRKVGFVLLVYPFGDDPGNRVNYISNGTDRKDIVALFKEMIARFEGQAEPPTGRA